MPRSSTASVEKLDKYDFNRCKANKHLCTCRQLDKYDRNRCRAVKHNL